MVMHDLCLWLRNAIKEVRSRRVRLIKDIGQHLMICCKLGLAICNELSNYNVNRILEIGTGAGFLTAFLSNCSKEVVSVEVDPRILSIGKDLLKDFNNIHLILGDGLKLLHSSAIRAEALVSNTPFYISTPLIIGFIKSKYELAILTVQKEVANRLVAPPGTKEYGRLSVLVSLFTRIKVVKHFSRNCFLPKPEVDVALISLIRIKSWEDKYRGFEEFVACLFSERRKKASKVLTKCINKLGLEGESNELLQLVSNKRVYQLSPKELWSIYNSLKDN